MKKIKSSRLSAAESKFLTRVMTLGTGTRLPVVMSPSELIRLIAVVYSDNKKFDELAKVYPGLWEKITPPVDFYEIPNEWFIEPVESIHPELHIDLLKLGSQQIEDFSTYLGCLSELHKRRRKYVMILSAQPLPKMIQVSPRALIEYGNLNPQALSSWLTWRKFFFDLDNRSAQESGYLFEPILTAAIGGVPKSAKTKVVKRTDDETRGRQVDCWKVLPNGDRHAYEFKLRVTNAASGQARRSEEIQFAEDCFNSMAIPILVVLDPTMNDFLTELQDAYKKKGGMAFVGDEAWAHLEDEAGPVMARFIEYYVRKPIADVSQFENLIHSNLLDFRAQNLKNEIVITIGEFERRILRGVDETLAVDDDDDENSESLVEL